MKAPVAAVESDGKNDDTRFRRFGGDAVEIARGKRGYLFRAFTSLPLWNAADSPEPQWRDFDIAAFKYALTALNQIEERGEERKKERRKLEQRADYMRGATNKLARSSEEETLPPGPVRRPAHCPLGTGGRRRAS